jgi:hypothetical protein
VGGVAGGYFALLRELREFRAGLLGGEPSDRALGRAAGVKADTVKAWLVRGQFPQDVGKLAAVVRAVAAEARSRGIVPADSQVAALDVEQWRQAHREEAQRRAGDVSAGVLRGQASRVLAGAAAGRPLARVTDPFALEVHRPVQAGNGQSGLPVLPTYVPREHDHQLAKVARAAADGASGIAVLVGGSSTGKTRACWEALRLLRERPEPWRLWHPIDPSRPEAALRELPLIGPRTVIWLNEAQFYLDAPAGGLGEQVAAGLRELLRDPERTPVLVLATLWPQFWDGLTARPQAGGDRHAQARELLAGGDITVPADFTPAEMPLLAAAGDPRLALAARAAEDGRVIQFLAGAPELMSRYRNAPPPALALISAAMDARRLGMGIALPLAFLEAAAPGYLADTDWEALPEDWLDQALAYTSASSNGTRGPLTRIRPRTASSPAPAPRAAYRLADYLEQHGRDARRQHIPPVSFWTAAARFASPGELPTLASAAEDRGLLRDAARLRKHAAGLGDSRQAAAFIRFWHSLNPHSPDPRPAQWAAAHASLDDPGGVAALLGALREAGAEEQAAVLARRAAAHVSLDGPGGVAALLGALRTAGGEEQAAALLARDPAAHVSLDTPRGVARLLDVFWEAGAEEQAAALAWRAAAHTPLDDVGGVAALLGALRTAGAEEQAAALLARDPAAHAPLDSTFGTFSIVGLLGALREAGAEEQAAALARRAAAHAPLDDPRAGCSLLGALRWPPGTEEQAAMLARRAATEASFDNPWGVAELLDALQWPPGTEEQAAMLARRAAPHVPLDDPRGVAELLRALRTAGAEEQAAMLARRAAPHVPLDDPRGVAALLGALPMAGAKEQTAALLARDPAAHVSLDHPFGVAALLRALQWAGSEEQAAALLARDPAAHVSLDNLFSVDSLLSDLHEAGAEEQAAALAWRAAAHAPLDNCSWVARLLETLRRAGSEEQTAVFACRAAAHAVLGQPWDITSLLHALQAAGAETPVRTLVDRLPAEGHFDLFRKQAGNQAPYHFGREPDGSPTPSWDWDNVD